MGSDHRTYKSMYETGKASEIVCCHLEAEICRQGTTTDGVEDLVDLQFVPAGEKNAIRERIVADPPSEAASCTADVAARGRPLGHLLGNAPVLVWF